MRFTGWRLYLSVALISSVLLIGKQPSVAQASNDVAARTQQLHSLFDEFWQYHLRIDPESATSLGDNRYNDRLTNHSAEFEYSTLEEEKKHLAKFQSIKTARQFTAAWEACGGCLASQPLGCVRRFVRGGGIRCALRNASGAGATSMPRSCLYSSGFHSLPGSLTCCAGNF